MEKNFGTAMYDHKYATHEETKPRSVVTRFIDEYLNENNHCLDLGCGSGRHSKYLAEKGINITAVDISEVGVEKTKEKLKEYTNSNILLADIHNLPFKNNAFDSLISNRVLDYNNDEQLEGAFAEMARVLKENSHILITIRSISQPPKENEKLMKENDFGGKTFLVTDGIEQGAFQHYFTEQEIKNLAGSHNFEITKIEEYSKTNEKGKLKTEWQVVMTKK